MKFRNLTLGASLLALGLGAWAQAAPTKTYIVQLSDAPVAAYNGGVAGIAATKPQAGTKLDMAAAPARNYEAMLSQKRASVLASVGNVPVRYSYSAVFNGFSAKLTEAQVKKLRSQPNVVSITESKLAKLQTTRTPEFLGIAKPGGLWSQLDAKSLPVKGEDVIIGIIDSGVWPEDPSVGDKIDANGKPVPYFGTGTQAYGPPPAKWKGICQTGEGFTAAMCNNKLIGARYYLNGFESDIGVLTDYEFRSPRNGDGHGMHTATTAGGNGNVDAAIDGIGVGVMSGMAPRARLAVYKVCWDATDVNYTGCYTEDSLKAIDDAVKDGVDVINFSVGGSGDDFLEPVEVAYFNAAAAGVFVAASASNGGPGNTLEHLSPWLTTVAASTHDRYTVAPVRLGSGASFSGPSYQRAGLPSSPLILASNAGVKPYASLSPADRQALERCYLPEDRDELGGTADAALDPAKTAGRIVVCLRGGNNLVNKGGAVRSANGVGMVLLNTPTSLDTVFNQPYLVPTVHLTAAAYPTVSAYAANSSATATFGPAVQQANVIAPVMADFSSRGPNRGNANILKPDLTGPGVDIIAGWVDDSLTQAQHDGLVRGSFRPKANAASLQGTSMSSPHIAGLAALLKQLHPTWSPAAIKSALMTTTNGVFLADGQPDLDRFGYGAGHVNPNAAADPGLVYDVTTQDYVRFLCGLKLQPPSGSGSCSTLGSIKPSDLNLASLTMTDIVATATMKRTVTNVSKATSTYVASVTMPGWNVVVSPSTLTIAPGASASFTVSLTPLDTAPRNDWTFGNLVWSDGTHRVTSPLTAEAAGFAVEEVYYDTRKSGRGTKVFQVRTIYDGTLQIRNTGLVPATTTPGRVLPQETQCHNFVVPAGTDVASFQMWDADVSQPVDGLTDIDLAVYDGPNGTGALIGLSAFLGSGENVTLQAPKAGTYSACAEGFSTAPGGATYVLSTWIFGANVAATPLRVLGPSRVYTRGTASVATSWSVTPGQRYLANIHFLDPVSKSIGTTTLTLDTK